MGRLKGAKRLERATITSVYKWKGNISECGIYRVVSLMSITRKVYGKFVIERV